MNTTIQISKTTVTLDSIKWMLNGHVILFRDIPRNWVCEMLKREEENPTRLILLKYPELQRLEEESGKGTYLLDDYGLHSVEEV